MKIESSQEKLQSAILQAARIAGKNTNLPVLGCVLLEATKKGLLVRATNLELGIEVRVPVKVIEEGVAAVPADAIGSLIASLYGGSSVLIERRENQLSVVSGKSRSLVKTIPHEDFPTLPKPPQEISVTLKASQLSEGFRSVWYCASVGSVKPELGSVLIQGTKGSLIFTATDSFRLGEKTIPVRGAPEFGQTLVPLRNVPELIKLLDTHEGEITLVLDKHQLSFTVGSAYVTSRLIEGSFPDYRQLIPKKSTTEAILLKQDLANAFKLSNIFSDQSHQVKFSITPAKKSFVLSSRNADVGESEDSLPAALSGEELAVSFNARYIAESLQSIHSDSVELKFSGLGKPLLISGVSDPSFLYLVMPMNR